jgi:SnoaL-like polyketide cyclase
MVAAANHQPIRYLTTVRTSPTSGSPEDVPTTGDISRCREDITRGEQGRLIHQRRRPKCPVGPELPHQYDRAHLVESDDQVVVCGRFRGTHTGALESPQGAIPASGNSIDVPFMDYFRVENGRIVEHEVVWDQMAMLGQLGAMQARA